MDVKVCNDCGKKVDVNSNFCPHCKSQSFRDLSTVEVIKYYLLYWKVDNGFMLSKTKVFSITFFLLAMINNFMVWDFESIFAVIIFTVILFFVGFALHKLLNNDKPSKNVVDNNDNGIVDDLVHLLFYWQDKETGEYAVSKTKIGSNIIFYLFALWFAVTAYGATLMGAVFIGCIFGFIAFLIGYFIHRVTKPKAPPVANTQIPVNNVPPAVNIQPANVNNNAGAVPPANVNNNAGVASSANEAPKQVQEKTAPLSEDEKILEEVRKQKSDSELYNQIGIVFPIDDLGGGVYGGAAYKIIYKNLDPSKMGRFKMYDGDTRATLFGPEGNYDYCIAIQSDDASVIKYVRETMALAKDKGLAPISKRFIYAHDLQNEPLVFAAEVNNGNVTIKSGGPPEWGLEEYKDKWTRV